MIKIYCLYYEGKYTPDYVEKLYNSLKRNCNVPFKFICYSDTEVVADEVIPLPKETKIKAHWHKLKFFDKEFTGEGDIIVMDIDQVILKDVTEMIDWKVGEKELVSYTKWWNNSSVTINGGWYKFKAGELQFVWDKYNSDPEKWQLHYYNNGTVHYKYFGEQDFVEDTCKENGATISKMPPQWLGKWTLNDKTNYELQIQYIEKFSEPYMFMGGEWNETIKIVHMSNTDNDVHSHEWVEEHWR